MRRVELIKYLQTILFEVGSGIPNLFISSGCLVDQEKVHFKIFFILGKEIK